MFCYNCGKEISNNANYCSECGAGIKRNSSTNEVRFLHIANSIISKVDERAVIRFVMKIVFAVIAVATFLLSKEALFSVGGEDFLGIGHYKDVGVSELVEYVEKYVEYMSYISSGIGNVNLFLFHVAEWCITIGTILYLVSMVLAFLSCESAAHGVTVIGFLLHIAFFVLCGAMVHVVFETDSVFAIAGIFSTKMWWYIVVNVVLIVISGTYFYGAEEMKQSSDGN